MVDVTKHVKELRQQLGLNQQQFAEMIGVSQSTVSKWERGSQRPDLESAVKMQHAGGGDINNYVISGKHIYARASWGVDVVVVGAINESHIKSRYQWGATENFAIRAPKRTSWENLDLLGFVVEDDSADPVYPRESIVVCARFDFRTNLAPRAGDNVVYLSPVNDHGDTRQFQVVVRQFALGRKGEVLLNPFNSEKPERRPFTLTNRMDVLAEGGYEAVGLVGVIVGGFIVEDPDRFAY